MPGLRGIRNRSVRRGRAVACHGGATAWVNAQPRALRRFAPVDLWNAGRFQRCHARGESAGAKPEAEAVGNQARAATIRSTASTATTLTRPTGSDRRAPSVDKWSPTRCRRATLTPISRTRHDSSAKAKPSVSMARSSQTHNRPLVAHTRLHIAASARDSPVSIRCAGGPPRATIRVSSTRSALPSSTATHPSRTASRPRRPHSSSMLCLGVSPQIDPGDTEGQLYLPAYGSTTLRSRPDRAPALMPACCLPRERR
jgi:hypothetical protein